MEPVSPPSSKKKALYLFAGKDRRTSIRAVLERFSKTFGGQEIECEEWDICRGPDNDLLDEATQRRLLQSIEAGEFFAILLSPPCASWSRAPWANRWGPRPLRTALHPWGLPWLEGSKLSKVAASNAMIRLCMQVLERAIALGLGVFLEHPENLGSVRSRPSATVRPASIWELPEIQRLQEKDIFTVAFYQCQFGSPSRKPTRVLTNLRRLRSWGWTSWPRLNRQGCYLGPLPVNCACGRTHQGLIKRSAEEAFATAEAAAYPEEMDLQIGWALWDLASQSPPSVSPSAGSLKTPEGGQQNKQGEEGKEEGQQHEQREEGGQERKRMRNEQDNAIPTTEEVDCLIEGARRAAQEEMSLGGKDKEGAKDDSVGREKKAGGVRKAPLQVHYKGRVRNLVDGLGKCFPGIRPAGARGTAQSPPARLLAKAFMEEVERLEASMSEEERRMLISKLVLGRFSSSPFEKGMEEVRSRLDERVLSLGKDPRRKGQDRETAINFRRLDVLGRSGFPRGSSGGAVRDTLGLQGL